MKKVIKFGLLAVFGVVAGMCLHVTGGHGHGELLLLGAAAPPVIPKNSKDLEGIRGFFGSLKQQFASTAEVYTGPIREMMDEVATKLEAALAALPKNTDGTWSLDDKLDNFFSLFSCANNALSQVTLELSKVKNQLASMVVLDDVIKSGAVIKKEDVDALVTAKIAERTGETGDLTTKELSKQLCSAAKDLGITEGKAAAIAEQTAAAAAVKLGEERKTALTAASLPLPEVEGILRDTEENFTAAKTTAEGRIKKFSEAGIDLPAELLGKVWLAENDFKTFESTVMGIPALKRAKTPEDEPLASPLAGGVGNAKIIL